VGNLGGVQATDTPHYGRAYSATVRIPPLGGLILVADESLS